MQNWDWNDDQTRPIFVLRSAFKPEVVRALQELLSGNFADARFLVLIQDSWDSDIWGGIVITRNEVAVQRNILQAYSLA